MPMPFLARRRCRRPADRTAAQARIGEARWQTIIAAASDCPDSATLSPPGPIVAPCPHQAGPETSTQDPAAASPPAPAAACTPAREVARPPDPAAVCPQARAEACPPDPAAVFSGASDSCVGRGGRGAGGCGWCVGAVWVWSYRRFLRLRTGLRRIRWVAQFGGVPQVALAAGGGGCSRPRTGPSHCARVGWAGDGRV